MVELEGGECKVEAVDGECGWKGGWRWRVWVEGGVLTDTVRLWGNRAWRKAFLLQG